MTKILLRFDDLNECMNWGIWDKIENILDQNSIKPIVAIVPENKDSTIAKWSHKSDFVSRYRAMQNKGYEIALHGYNHTYITKHRGIYGLSAKSEFSGISEEIQQNKIVSALKIFQDYGLETTTWVAPNHSFDKHTINILSRVGFDVICDGLHREPYMLRSNLLLVPCQRWDIRRLSSGLITVCYHHNNWKDTDLLRFKLNIEKHKCLFTNIKEVKEKYWGKRKKFNDYINEKYEYLIHHKLKEKLKESFF